MANKLFRGDAPVVREVYTLVVGGTVEATDVFNTIINGKTVALSATTTSTSTTATEIEAALEAAGIDEFDEVDWTVASSTVTGTGPSDGTPVTISVTTTEAGGGAADAQTYVATNTVNAQGPEDWNVAANWSASGVPSADVVYIDNFEGHIKYGLDQSAIDITAMNILASMTGDIGLPDQSEAGDYYEYRPTYLVHQTCTTYNVGEGEGAGSGRLRLNASAAASTLNMWRTGPRKDPGIPSLLWKGTHATNVVNAHRGDLGIAYLPGETAVVATLRVGWVTDQLGDCQVWCGAGVTLTTVIQTGGRLVTNSAGTTMTQQAGEWIAYSGAWTTINCRNATVTWNSTGTITTLNLDSDGVFDADQDERAFTITNCTLKKGATIKNMKGRITFTNGIILDGCGLNDVTLELRDDITLTVTYN